ncbi:TOMM precursor leader peptide-binding protein [Nostoc flagelliforme FACHB-838]|uniref:TOMM leader peptide-binding protein n=1 Tax=Nostoc flagelliforme FACHB-838 TaxID=2692904 RepID=A0ABR8DKY3_9NOSO|nr:TOMM precursor leader peptide-binding protein [Nostoc flagelliforme]MBD2530124.1 TOMM precursor leader peptide-binding protein [Nostoc flagelliforme FACHB-838]
MINQPRFKACFRVETLEPDSVFLLSEKDNFFLKGRLYYLLAALLDGCHNVDSIVNKLQGQASTAEIYYALTSLENKGYIIETDDMISDENAAFWNFLDVDPKVATSRLQTTKVAVTSFGTVTPEPFLSMLESLNIQVGDDGDISVVFTDDYLRADLDAFNQKALKFQRPWMLVKPIGTIVWVGPIFHPGKTGCWACLAQRLQTQRRVETFVQRKKGIAAPLTTSLAGLPSTFQTVLAMAATEAVKWIVNRENKQLDNTMVTFDVTSLEIQNHTLTRRPQCPYCGEPKYLLNKKQQPLVLESRKKTFTADGGHRYSSPEATFKEYQHHISPITGIVNGLKRLRRTENGLIHIYSGGQNLALTYDSFHSLRRSLRSRSAGKGMTEYQAKVSCLCESLERYSGVFQGDEIRKKASYKEMGEAAIYPNACMNFSEVQYKNRKEWNAKLTTSFHWVPNPFDEEVEIEWTPVWSLTYKEFKYLPTAYCYFSYPLLNRENAFCNPCSNGNAAGNTIEEAILQGFMELVERDSVCLWWYNRVRRPVVDLDTFNEPYFQSLKDYYKTIQRDIWVLDITSDLNIPTFIAVSRRTDKEIEDIILGCGTHFDPRIAILRALTEANQSLPAVFPIAVDESGEYAIDDSDTINWWKTATLENQPYLVPDESVAPRVCSDYAQLWSDDLLKDVMTCVDIAEKNGMETLVLDQTRPDVGLSVVKVIVPGMRHFWARFGPGRLYDVPVKLGWIKESQREDKLNPIPFFY